MMLARAKTNMNFLNESDDIDKRLLQLYQVQFRRNPIKEIQTASEATEILPPRDSR